VRNLKQICAFLFLSTTSSLAQTDNLEPVGGIFDVYDFQFEYYSKVRNILFQGMTQRPVIRFLVLPSFSEERVLAIEEDREKGTFYIVFRQVDKNIWYNEEPDAIKLKSFKKEIKTELVELIRELFVNALGRTRYPDNELPGLDGTNYYISAKDSGPRSGTVWSPPANTKLGRLVSVGNELMLLMQTQGVEIDVPENLRSEISKLAKEFK
jgi:hypothetical protein